MSKQKRNYWGWGYEAFQVPEQILERHKMNAKGMFQIKEFVMNLLNDFQNKTNFIRFYVVPAWNGLKIKADVKFKYQGKFVIAENRE